MALEVMMWFNIVSLFFWPSSFTLPNILRAAGDASFMSQNYGAGKPDRVKKSYFIALAYSFGVGLVLGGSLFIFGRQFLALFTTEGAVIDAGMKRVGVMGFALSLIHI